MLPVFSLKRRMSSFGTNVSVGRRLPPRARSSSWPLPPRCCRCRGCLRRGWCFRPGGARRRAGAGASAELQGSGRRGSGVRGADEFLFHTKIELRANNVPCLTLKTLSRDKRRVLRLLTPNPTQTCQTKRLPQYPENIGFSGLRPSSKPKQTLGVTAYKKALRGVCQLSRKILGQAGQGIPVWRKPFKQVLKWKAPHAKWFVVGS
jgi:hypothetical protein